MPSPAMIVALLALCIGLGGTAIAANLGKPQVRKIAAKQADKRLRANTVGSHVNRADLATSAANADTLDGKHAGDLESRGFHVSSPAVPIAAGPDTTTILTLDLPAGSYLVIARAEFNNNNNANVAKNQLDCELGTANVEAVLARNLFLAADGDPGESQIGSTQLVTTLDEPGRATMFCDAGGGWVEGNALDPTITAVSLQP